jgi:hypothetical protein
LSAANCRLQFYRSPTSRAARRAPKGNTIEQHTLVEVTAGLLLLLLIKRSFSLTTRSATESEICLLKITGKTKLKMLYTGTVHSVGRPYGAWQKYLHILCTFLNCKPFRIEYDIIKINLPKVGDG